ATAFEIDGVDQTGAPVSATVQVSYAGPASTPAALSAAQNLVALNVPTAPASTSATLGISYSGGGSITTTVLPANQSAAWLAATITSSNQITLEASAAGLSPGVYNAALLIGAASAIPQFIEVPVVFLVGNTSGIAVNGLVNGASFQPAFAPGMVLSVFGSGLSQTTQTVSAFPLPNSLSGVSATINGISAPFYYVSPTQLNIQIPYETGSGPAILGINNNGQVAYSQFSVSPAATGIFTDSNHALVPQSTARPGDTLLMFVTGEGEVSPPLLDGVTPFFATPINLLPQPLLPVTVTVGGIPAQILFAGVASGLAGATQVNFVVPANAPLGAQQVVAAVGGIASPPANITISE
ncbi:MAG: peptidase S8, partial [Acidobacteriia bacterium]|nr:peptidase S8 [Terriglobia bacterium]